MTFFIGNTAFISSDDIDSFSKVILKIPRHSLFKVFINNDIFPVTTLFFAHFFLILTPRPRAQICNLDTKALPFKASPRNSGSV